ncbi:DNA cytosine C5-methyltransferase, M.Sac I family [Syntrophotalea carbinolica DSM 2380]|uniref:Cytosine-specific methyltransferase n=1 Tax=Syntrophotalea carbinolica (strain DSM 2380 / NBRC 103641 / GraBd1) TaxID=338963 RepID=Q3A7G5_SYNC1|nr:DNA cytosine methyltransferase [Syntrophotalea carbinolica]ABA87679.1 DNA cytosine C5-methyltransferase, M.Sac I family [Syntrophotalea carbinolica DSM 2380]
MLKTISLYTGAGGLDLGLEAAGFETTVAVEIDKWACQTLCHNRPNWNPIEEDIHNVSCATLSEIGGFNSGEASLLIGGPPCQPFSKAAYWVKGDTKRLDDPRADTLTAYLRVLKDLTPKAFLMENVFGITYKGKDEAIQLLRRIVNEINREKGTKYTFSLGVLNAANYGVPQVRERVFIVGSRDGKEFQFPEPTHQNPESISESLFPLSPWLTSWDAIGDLDELEHENLKVKGKWGDLLPSIPEGSNYLHHTDRGEGLPLFGWRTRYWSFLLKLSKSRPSWTIQAQPGSAIGPFHWKSRRLSPREMCRLQTFPDTYEVLGSLTEIQRQLGNAVPSLIGEVLGREIRRQFFNGKISNPLRLLQKTNNNKFKREVIHPVPPKYLPLQGDHKAHPGTGRGPQAIVATA